ncbi:hypothetical protein [Oleiharenicola sp. Vm1]|uniref:hypothetical protein n=1 Tax=Oleiharenicola sp. Vm1 TaxID=3398393 RepID=UPI0039F51BF3
MNRPLLFIALAVSLAGNAWYLVAAKPRLAAATAAAPSATKSVPGAPVARSASLSAAGVPEDKTATDAAGLRGLTWHTPTTDDDFRALAAELRAAGMPSRLIYTVLSELYSQQAIAASPLARTPYWQRRAVEQSKEMMELRAQIDTKLRDLLGPDARLSARIDPVQRARRYGDLPDAKIDALAQIERDYQEMRSDVYRTTGSGAFTLEEWAAQQKQTNLLKDELRADVAKILTPAELAAYELRNSDTARLVANAMRDIALTPEEFAAVYAARQALDAATPPVTGVISGEQALKRREAQAAYAEAVKGALQDDRFYQFLAATDADYRTVMNLSAQFPQVTPAASYQVMRLKNEMDQARVALFRSSPSMEAIQTAYAGWNARLDTLLGAPAADAYRKTQSGRTFSPPVIRRAPPASGSTSPRG